MEGGQGRPLDASKWKTKPRECPPPGVHVAGSGVLGLAGAGGGGGRGRGGDRGAALVPQLPPSSVYILPSRK